MNVLHVVVIVTTIGWRVRTACDVTNAHSSVMWHCGYQQSLDYDCVLWEFVCKHCIPSAGYPVVYGEKMDILFFLNIGECLQYKVYKKNLHILVFLTLGRECWQEFRALDLYLEEKYLFIRDGTSWKNSLCERDILTFSTLWEEVFKNTLEPGGIWWMRFLQKSVKSHKVPIITRYLSEI